MEDMTLHIKNMVCERCIRAVRRVLLELELDVQDVGLGYATIGLQASAPSVPSIESALVEEGFGLVEDRKAVLVERAKALLIELIHTGGLTSMKENVSVYLSKQLRKDYHYVSTLFSQLESVTIERFVILQKIERAKELLAYGEHTLTEIANQLGYSNVAYLSAQFKQVTGFTPSAFKKLKHHNRMPLDRLT